jgi:hypothetical protein
VNADEALVDPYRVLYWGCDSGPAHSWWLLTHLSLCRLYLVRRLGVLFPEDRDHQAVLLCQLQVCGRIVDLEVDEAEWASAAVQSQIRAKAAYN